MKRISYFLAVSGSAFVLVVLMATVAWSQKSDLPSGAREKAKQGNSSGKTVSGYGYGEKVSNKDQSRIAPDRDTPSSHKGDLPAGAREKAAQGNSAGKTATGYGYGEKGTNKDQSRLTPDRDYNGPVTHYHVVNPPRGAVQPPSIREQFGNRGSHFDYRAPSPYGHYYNGFYSIGRWNMSPEQAKAKITADLNRLHPFRAVGIGQRVTLGNRFILSAGGHVENPVRVIENGPRSFTLLAERGHMFQGTVKFEVFKDSSGEMWIHVEGRGVDMEHPMQQRYNSHFAEVLWPMMATNASRILAEQ